MYSNSFHKKNLDGHFVSRIPSPFFPLLCFTCPDSRGIPVSFQLLYRFRISPSGCIEQLLSWICFSYTCVFSIRQLPVLLDFFPDALRHWWFFSESFWLHFWRLNEKFQNVGNISYLKFKQQPQPLISSPHGHAIDASFHISKGLQIDQAPLHSAPWSKLYQPKCVIVGIEKIVSQARHHCLSYTRHPRK